jgi:SAM-dependent methyltransferase
VASSKRRFWPSTTNWSDYLRRFHRDRPGITERLLENAVIPGIGTPYQWLVMACESTPGRVVDLGCGSAPIRPLLGEPEAYVGIDVSRSELSVAQAEGRGPVIEADVMALPLPDASVDVVFSSMSVMLFDPIETALAEIARVLRPGGRFVSIRPVTFPVEVTDVRVGLELFRGLRSMPALPQWLGRSRFARMQAAAGLRVIDDRALRFSHPLVAADDARLIVDSLYLPTVPVSRREAAVRRLTRLAGPGRDVPVSIRRTVSIKG